jgi:Xaa-Pro dipeptidase
MTQPDSLRVMHLQEMMNAAGLDALICRLPENVLYLTDYWPIHGVSVAVLRPQGKPTLFVPQGEVNWTKPDWAEVVPFGWGLLGDDDLYASYRKLLGKLGLAKAKIGVEMGAEVVGASYRHAEPVVPAGPWFNLMREVFPQAEWLLDAVGMLQKAKLIKTDYDLERLRVANEIAHMGASALLEQLKPGMSEAQASAIIEGTIRAKGPGYKGARMMWAEAEVASGPENTLLTIMLVPPTTRLIEEGDLVLVEMATVVDGYYSDLTYMAVAGEPSARQREVHNAVLAAQQSGAAQMRPGNPFSAADKAARDVLTAAGLGEWFIHGSGHGLGFRFHESTPGLTPDATGTFETGMVSSIEPGVYIPGFGGVRIEDNVAVGEDGPDFLSTPRTPW